MLEHSTAPSRRHGTAWATTPDGVPYRDLNRNGVLDPFEDSRLPIEVRVDDLMGRLTLAEKAGLMYQAVATIDPAGRMVDDVPQLTRPVAHDLVTGRLINHINLQLIPGPRETASWMNQVQALAEAATPHGIPVTFSSDPRHSFIENVGASFRSKEMSAWPEPLGLGALRDPAAVREFAEIARREYVALGLRSSLHPTLDLATEPRWARQYSTFGADADLAAEYGVAYLDGFQGAELGPENVACMLKHFPGGGAQANGEDPHFPYGREQVYPGGGFEYHLAPFRRAIERGVSAIMLYYGMPVGLVRNGEAIEEVGFGYNRQIVTGLLREELGFDGVVCTDWGLVSDTQLNGKWLPARAWGVEHLAHDERVARIVDAGCDQLGGENDPSAIVRLVESGILAESRIDESVRRLLRVKMQLGLFDDPYVDEDAAVANLGLPAYFEAGHRAQARSITVLVAHGAPLVPAGSRVYAPDLDPDDMRARGLVPVGVTAEADLVVLRIAAPFEARDEYMLEASFHAGSLEFASEVVDRVAALASEAPVILDVSLDRPAVLTPLLPHATSVVASYGASGAALLDALTGRIAPEGRLPFELPRDMATVERSRPDLPDDLDAPLFPRGAGLGLNEALRG